MESKISIILSFSQLIMDEEDENHYLDQFANVNDLKPLYEKVGRRVFFLGGVQKKKGIDVELVKKNVYKQRKILINHIMTQSDSYNVKQLKVYTDNLTVLQQVREIVMKYCESMKSCELVSKFDRFIKQYNVESIDNDNSDDSVDDDAPDNDSPDDDNDSIDDTANKQEV